MKRKIILLSLAVIVPFSSLLFFSVNFDTDKITIYQLIYIALYTLIAFLHLFIITKIDPALQKLIKKRALLFISRLITLVLVGVFIYLFEYTINLIWQNRVMSIGLLLMLLPTITVFVGIVLYDEKNE